MQHNSRISTDHKVLLGKPVIKNTRIPVEMILKKLSQGATHEDLLKSYPRLQPEDIFAALEYASSRIANEEDYQAGS